MLQRNDGDAVARLGAGDGIDRAAAGCIRAGQDDVAAFVAHWIKLGDTARQNDPVFAGLLHPERVHGDVLLDLER